MVGFWFFLIIVLALLALIGAAILSSMAANAAGNGNVSTGVSFSIWSAVLTALAAILIIIAAIVAWYRADTGSLKGSRLGWGFGLTIFIAILFLIGATILSVMSANSSDAASVKSNAIWAAVVTAVGGFIVLVGLFIAIYFGREEVGVGAQKLVGNVIYEASDEYKLIQDINKRTKMNSQLLARQTACANVPIEIAKNNAEIKRSKDRLDAIRKQYAQYVEKVKGDAELRREKLIKETIDPAYRVQPPPVVVAPVIPVAAPVVSAAPVIPGYTYAAPKPIYPIPSGKEEMAAQLIP